MAWRRIVISALDRQFDSGVAMLTMPRGAPRLHWGLGDVWGGIKNVGSTIKKAAVDTGHELGRAASNPVVQGLTAAGLAATGVGAPAAAAIMAAQRGGGALLKPGGNIGAGLRGGVEGAAMGAGAAKAGSLVRGVLSNGLPSASSVFSSGGALKDAAGKLISGGAGGLPASIASAAGLGGGGVSPLVGLLAGAQMVNATNLGAKANQFADEGWNLAKGSYMDRAGLRSKGIEGLTNPVTRDTSALSSIRNTNPVAARAAAVAPARSTALQRGGLPGIPTPVS
jgi:hypothetical protein